jgi:hypothetical protein
MISDGNRKVSVYLVTIVCRVSYGDRNVFHSNERQMPQTLSLGVVSKRYVLTGHYGEQETRQGG